MGCISLDGDWRLAYLKEGKVAHPDGLAAVDLECVPAKVPGNVELDLVRAGIIPDPFYADNVRRLRAFEPKEWWYTREFAIPKHAVGERWDLVFAGLDTLATVWVNGVEVGRAANMLIEHRFDVTGALKPGETNHIAVRLGSALNHARRFHYDASLVGAESREEGLFIRKAPHVWGWDIMPRVVSAGIWRPVWLETHPSTAIEQMYYWTAGVVAGGAALGARFQFRTELPTLDGLAIRFHGICGEHAFEYEWPVEFVAGRCYMPVPDACLWWPKGYGTPNLYTITAQLCQGEQVLAERVDRIGIRKLVVERTQVAGAVWSSPTAAGDVARVDVPPDPASRFVFYVNDEPIMVKGSNWVPLDALHSRDAERVDQAVGLLDDLGCNMVRCWGGNAYPDHRFFDLCDEIRRFISPERLWPWWNNDEWQVHSVYHWQHKAIDRDRIQLMANQVRELFGVIPDNLDEFALASQITQAEAKKFFIESTRLRKWHTSGIL